MKNNRQQQHPFYLILMGLILAGITVGTILHYRHQNPGADLVLASGQDGGVYVQLAGEFETMIEKHLPKVGIELLQSAGSVENVALLNTREADLALVQNDIPGSTDLRTVAPLHFDYLHFLVRKAKGIAGFRDLEDKRFITGLEGSGCLPIVEALLEYFGIAGRVEIDHRSVTDGIADLRSGKTDALILMLGFQAPAIRELLMEEPDVELVKLSYLEAEALRGFALAYPTCRIDELPPYCYGDDPSYRVPTLAIQTLLVAHQGVSPDVIKQITEALFSHRSELIHQHPAAAQMTESFGQASVSFPIHEGARQYYSRDEPGFIIQYAEMMAFLLSLTIAVYGFLRVMNKWIIQRQKDRIDVYYLEAEAYLQRLEGGEKLSLASLDEIEEAVLEMRKVAFRQLADEKLIPDASFRILQHLLGQCESKVQDLRGKLPVESGEKD